MLNDFIKVVCFLNLAFGLMFVGVTAQTTENMPKNNAAWQTPAEKTDYRTTPRFAETLDYLKKLASASPLIRVSSFGKSGEGRELILVVAAKDQAFTPEIARKQGKAIVLVQACIHAGESDGKDAGLALLRDIALSPKSNVQSPKFDAQSPKSNVLSLLDNVVFVFEPIYNVDGHENFSAFKRINQNGPQEMGFRGNATNLNLNRDYMKADAPETRAFLSLWNAWNPDFFVDCHVTDGADYQYNLTYHFEHHQTAAPSIKNWLEDAFDKRIIPATERAGNLLAPYLSFRDNRDLLKGIEGSFFTPRFSHSYVAIRNRPALLIETHMLKNYKNRVRATYDFLRFMLEEINQNKEKLFAAIKTADAETANLAHKEVPLRLELTEKSQPFDFKGVESKIEKSEISGTDRVIWSDTPRNQLVPVFDETKVALSITAPTAYIIPPQWTEVIKLLELHGVKIERTPEAQDYEVETYRLSQPKFAANSFESRIILRDFKIANSSEKRSFPANSAIIRLNQPLAKVAVYLLEPQSPESFASWGFFNTIFEQKEYGEGYVLEKLAREMLAKDENLRREFAEKLKSDENFAKSPSARLNFFYERSPYFTEQNIGLYPVGRMVK